ncbi:MAG: CotH kinase family protein [Myxococcota bacterium]
MRRRSRRGRPILRPRPRPRRPTRPPPRPPPRPRPRGRRGRRGRPGPPRGRRGRPGARARARARHGDGDGDGHRHGHRHGDDLHLHHPPPPRLLINELCAANATGLVDESGEHVDWIELYNPEATDFALGGLTITDDRDVPDQHTLDPSLVVPAGGHLVLYADDDTADGPLHLGFKLSSGGEEVDLYDGATLVARVAFGPLATDTSLARLEDGGADFTVTQAPTPGAANGPVAATLGPVSAAPPPRCVPALTVDAPWPLEGEHVALPAACTNGAALPGATVLSNRSGPALVGGEITWDPTLSDAGPAEILLVLDGAGVPETALATLDVVDAWDDPSNVLVDPLDYPRELGVPVLHLDPAGPLTQSYVDTDAWYDGVHYTATMKIRGAASASYAKPSYTLEFEPEQIDVGDLGLGHKDHLVLISNFDDSAYVRQKLVYDTWAAMSEMSGEARLVPRTAFVVVYLDGVYQGLYTAIDHIDDEFVREMGFDDTANVYKSVSHDANFYLTLANGQPKVTLHEGWEKKEGLPEGDFTDLEDLTAFAGSVDHPTFDAEVDQWVSRSEFEDWFSLVHWMAADDSGGKNAYLVHDPVSGLFRYVPWDFNHSLGQNWYTARIAPDVYNDFVWTNAVFWHFINEPAAAQLLWDRVASHRAVGGPLDPDVLLAKVDEYYALVAPSCERDWAKWEAAYWARFGWARTDHNSFDDEQAYVEQWIADRGAWPGP